MTQLNTAIIPGFCTTNEPHDYTYLDTSASRSSWQYRLKQVDLDGAEHFTEAINVSSVTSVKEVAPTEFGLRQNYPNPFNPTTTITFQIPNDGHVSLKVFDMVGREVATLVSETRTVGVYNEVFDASSLPAGRQGLASGMYFYKLESGNFVQTKKMLVLR